MHTLAPWSSETFEAFEAFETFAVRGGASADRDGPSVFERGIVAAMALVKGALTVDGTFCVGSACVDTVAFGRALRSSTRSEALAVQTLASSVFTVNSMRGNSALLPSQSVVILTFVDGDYDALLSDPAGTAAFAAAVGAAAGSTAGLPPGTVVEVVSTLAGNAGGRNGGIDVNLLITYPKTVARSDASAATAGLISSFRAPPSDFSKLGITGVSGADATAAVGSHTSVFATWGASEETYAAVDAASDRRDFIKAKFGRS